MLKLCGAVLIFVACSFWGIGMHRRMQRRVQVLAGLENAFASLRTEIVFLQTPLPQAVLKIADATGDAIFSALGARLRDGQTPLKAMQSVLAAQNCLTAADEDVLLYAAAALGSSDAAGQDRHMDAVLGQIAAQQARAREKLQASGRLCLATGVLGGVLLVILLA